MKKLLVVVLAVVALVMVSCTKPTTGDSVVCSLAKYGTDLASGKISDRWSCDKAKLYTFLVAPVEANLCKKEVTDKETPEIIKKVCPLVIGSLVNLGAAKIATDFSCDLAKVTADFADATKICDKL